MPAVFPLFLYWLESIWQLCNSKVTQFRWDTDHFKSVDVDVITVYNLTLWTWTCFNLQLWRWSSSLWWQPRRRWRKVRKSRWSASEKTLEPGRAPKVWEKLLPAASWCYSEVTGMWSAGSWNVTQHSKKCAPSCTCCSYATWSDCTTWCVSFTLILQQEVEQYRRAKTITVKGRECPNPITQFCEASFPCKFKTVSKKENPLRKMLSPN